MTNGIQTYKDTYAGIPSAYSTPPINYQVPDARSASLIRELSPTEHLLGIMQELMGKVFDKSKGKYIEIEGVQPLMNMEGINMFYHFATSAINPIVTMSNYTRDYRKIHQLVKMQVWKASRHFHLHYKDYGINRKTKITIITDKLMILVLSCYYKALGAGDRKAATSHISESINTMVRPPTEESPQVKRKGIVQKMFN